MVDYWAMNSRGERICKPSRDATVAVGRPSVGDGAGRGQEVVGADPAVWATTASFGMPELVHQVRPGHAEGVGHPLHREPPGGGDARRPAVPTQRLGLHRTIAAQRTALEALTPKRVAAARHDAPEATAATTRSRRSTDSAFDMLTGLLASEHRITSRQPARSQAIQSGRKPL